MEGIMSESDHSEFSSTTEGIRVTVFPEFIPEQSNPLQNTYAFAYTVSIENLGGETVQLVNRHWVIYSAEKQFDDVKGEGVVGQQPIIRPSESFRYTSGAIIDSPFGHMEGSYTFRSSVKRFFDVLIPKFDLVFVESNAVN